MNQIGGAFSGVEPRSGLLYASFGQRAGAYLLDGVVALTTLIVAAVVAGVAGVIDPGLGSAVSLIASLAYFAVSFALLIVGDGGALGQTLGKHLVGIKVVGPQPGPIGYGAGALRCLGRMVDNIFCCFPVGLIWPLFDNERRAWHDIVADTRVVVAPPGEQSLGYWWRNVRLSGSSPAGPAAGDHVAPGGANRARAGLALGLVTVVAALVAGAVLVVDALTDDTDSGAPTGAIGGGDAGADEFTGDGAPPSEPEVQQAPVTQADRSTPAIGIGAQDFGESAILAEIYEQALDTEGFDASVQEVGGFRDELFIALESGRVNMAPDYVASELSFLNGTTGRTTADVDTAFEDLQEALDPRGLVALQPSEAVDTNAFVVTPETAQQHGLTTLSDLARVGQDFTVGGTQDCETNPWCLPGLREVYGLDLSPNFVQLDPGLTGTALEEGSVDVAPVFSTDGRIPAEGWVLLEDDKQMAGADNVFPVATQDLIDAHGTALTDVLDTISAELTTEDLALLNMYYDIDKQDADVIATSWLADHGLA
jgi:osmoprotectant transport system substrate-binding protein